jgi:preprotein translocase subunit YajC
MELIFLPLLFLLMWLLFIRPQQKRVQQHRELVESLAVGDEVVTGGGLLGTITALEPEQVRVEVAPGVELRLLRGAISRRLTPASAGDAPSVPADDEIGTDERP